MKSNSKKYQEVVKKNKKLLSEPVSLEKASKNIGKLAYTEFTSSVELHVNLTPKVTKDKTFKGSVTFPHSTGKDLRIIVFTSKKTTAEKAKKAGAVEAGNEKLIKKVEDGYTDFDVAIAEPELMSELAKLGRILGPKGLMPNPKNGTVTKDVLKAMEKFQSGKVNFKADKGGSVHLLVGNVEMDAKKIEENVRAAIDAILKSSKKPVHATLDQVYMAPAMGPSMEVTISSF
jgi:large subunit ribosomal protein L1